MEGLLRAAIAERMASGALAEDPAQRPAIEALSRLEADLGRPRGLLGAPKEAIRGVYLFGPVGRGKSLLMDLFFDTAPAAPKRRAHFHPFMVEAHARIAQWRNGDAADRRAVFGRVKGDDPIPPLARLIASESRLLALDEFQVTDIADAMLLGRLFEALFACGVVVVATSNRAPDDLYAGGLNRQLFLPFIELIKARVEIVEVAGGRDWRLDRLRVAGVWFAPPGDLAEAAFDRLWREMVGAAGETGATLEVLGRRLFWPRASGSMLRANFASLCGQALGPADYLAIAQRFGTVFLERLPRLGPERREEAKRLATLIDALYEARARLVVLAETEPAMLYPQGEQAFEFQRTASRLEEMRSTRWLEGA